MTSDVCGRDVTDWGDGVMMTSLGEKDDGQSRMGKLFLPSRYCRIPSSTLHLNQGDCVRGWQMAGLPVLLEAGDCYERLARK
jgi:hypothetical protein